MEVPMRFISLIAAFAISSLWLAGAPQNQVSQGTAADESAIRKIVADSTDAWNSRDAKALAAHFSKDHDHINVNGAWRPGRTESEKALTDALAATRIDMTSSVAKIRFLTANIAIVVIRYEYSDDKRSWKSIATSVLHKIDGTWWNEAFQNTLVQPRQEAVAKAARARSPMAQTEPEVIAPTNSKTGFSEDVAAIRKIIDNSVDAWNRRDPEANASHLSEEHDHISVIGEWRQGKAGTEKEMAAALLTVRSTLARSIAKIRFITSDVAIVIVRNEYTDDKETVKSISTTIFRKTEGHWWNEAFQNTYIQPTANTSTAAPTGAPASTPVVYRAASPKVRLQSTSPPRRQADRVPCHNQ